MSKQPETQQLYNEEFKRRFIENDSRYQLNTQKNVYSVLAKAYDLEVEAGKDLYDFSYEELRSMFDDYRKKSKASYRSAACIVRRYITFAIEEGFVKTKINFASMFVGKEMDEYVRKEVKDNQYLTDIKDLYNIKNKCKNAQDAVIFYLLYDGVRNVEELQNLRKTDCNFETNTLTLTQNDGTQRDLIVSDETMRLIYYANKQKSYQKKNGQCNPKTCPTIPVADTEYVLRPTGQKKTGMISSQGIVRRIKDIAIFINNPYLNMQNIWISGQIHVAKQIKNELGRDLKKAEYEMINEKFGYDKRYYTTTKERIESYI